MKTANTLIVISLCASLINVKATNIPIPDGNFDNLAASINAPPLLGTTTATVGAWTAEMTGVFSLDGSMRIGPAASLDAPLPPDGTYELDIDLPASTLESAELSQTLTNAFLPDSQYTLSVDLDQGSVLNLVSGANLRLNAGTETLASLTGAELAAVLNASTNFQTVALTYKTGNTAPTNAMNFSFTAGGLDSLGGNIYVANFQLTVAPIQVQLSSVTQFSGNSMSFSGSGGAADATYKIISTTNLFLPTTSWTPVTTNRFDANGNFNLTFNINPTISREFFKVVIP